MFNKDFSKDPTKMSTWELYLFGFKFIMFYIFHRLLLTLAGVAGMVWMFLWSWQNLGW